MRRIPGAIVRALAVLITVATTLVVASGVPGATTHAAPTRALSSPPRVLLIGDSILNQQGGAAAFVLRQAGIVAKSDGIWGSGLLTSNQYNHGRTIVTEGWFKLAAADIADFKPDIVAVYLNHNYWPPYPLDAAGHVIDNLWSPSGQAMIRAQARALIGILRARGAKVYFIAPIITAAHGNPDPSVWNAIWHGYLPVLAALHVPIINSGAAVEGAGGVRVDAKPSCDGRPAPVRLTPGNIHLSRFGAALAGTALAQALAAVVHRGLAGNRAPGDRTAALVPTPAGDGYWLVGCDGSIYHFGHAAPLIGKAGAFAAHRGVVTATPTASGHGLWLIAADGTIVAVGDAAPLHLRAKPRAPIVAATVTPEGLGVVATDASGAVYTGGRAPNQGSMRGIRLNAPVRAIELTRDGRGYWLIASDGGIFGFGDARFHGSMGGEHLNQPIMNMAATPSGRGYWLVGADGGIFGFGDAQYDGNAIWHTPPYPLSLLIAPPGPAVDLVAAPGAHEGYWVVRDNGRVNDFGAAVGHAGTNNLAWMTP